MFLKIEKMVLMECYISFLGFQSTINWVSWNKWNMLSHSSFWGQKCKIRLSARHWKCMEANIFFTLLTLWWTSSNHRPMLVCNRNTLVSTYVANVAFSIVIMSMCSPYCDTNQPRLKAQHHHHRPHMITSTITLLSNIPPSG